MLKLTLSLTADPWHSPLTVNFKLNLNILTFGFYSREGVYEYYEDSLESLSGHLGATLGNFWIILGLLWVYEGGFG